MRKKAVLIVIIALSLIAFLIYKSFFIVPKSNVRIIDRLPDTSYKGKIHVLDFSKNIQRNLKEMQVPFRDFLSPDFLLEQSKKYGLNIQNPIYFFGENETEWGLIIEVNDKEKLSKGLLKIKKIFDLKDTIVNEKKLIHHPISNIKIYNQPDLILLYMGNDFYPILNKVTNAKKGDVSTSWKEFLEKPIASREKVIISNTSKEVKSIGFQEIVLSHEFDSTYFKIKTKLSRNFPINISLKNKGLSFKRGKYTNLFANIHLDITKFRNTVDESLLKFIHKLTKNIGFPIKEFINAWEGDLCILRGGFYKMNKEYFETEMDDDFNPIQVKKRKKIKVPEFSVLLTLNENKEKFFNSLIKKGLLRKEGDYYYFLFSPALRLSEEGKQFIFYSGKYRTPTVENEKNKLMIEYKSNKIEFSLDSIKQNEIFGGAAFPLNPNSNPFTILKD